MKKQMSWLLILTLLIGGCSRQRAVPKNIIIIIGDDMGFNDVEAASLYHHGREGDLTAQQFPVRAAVSTYSASGHGYDPQRVLQDFDYLKMKPTDSAAAATALACGVKTYNGSIGVDTLGQPVTNLLERAEAKGKATGVVTSVPFSHATPAGFVAHDSSRGNYHVIAEQMLLQSSVDVIIGCGHPYFNDDGLPLTQPDFHYLSLETWQAVMDGKAADADGDGSPDPWMVIESREDFLKTTEAPPKRLFGIVQKASTLQYGRSGADGQRVPFDPPPTFNTPSLAELASTALAVLEQNRNGFVVMIEAGAVDWASHGNHTPRMLEEMADFEQTVKSVVNWVESRSRWNETLVVVTADHETGYLNGPGSGNVETSQGKEPFYAALVNRGRGMMPAMEWHIGNHTNRLVPLYVRGCGAEALLQRARNNDPLYGRYLDNTDLAAVLIGYLQ